MNDNKTYYQEIIFKLKQLENKQKNVKAALGLQYFLIASSFIFLIIITAENIFRFNASVRTVIFFVFIAINILLLGYFFFYPLMEKINPIKKFDFLKSAKKVGILFPQIKDELLNSLQLIKTEGKNLYSSALINAAFNKLYQKIHPIDFNSALKYDKPKKYFKYTLIIGAVIFLIIVVIPGLTSSANRFINYSQHFIKPQKFYFIIKPGNITLTKGESISIQIIVSGDKPNEINFFSKDEAQTKYEKQNLLANKDGSFSYELNSIQNTTEYFLSAEGIESEKFFITIINRPIIKNLDLLIIPPLYSNLPQVQQKDNGNISNLFGSEVQLSLMSNKELKNGFLFFSDSSKINLNISSNIASCKFKIRDNVNYKIFITDLFGNKNLSPIEYSIKTEIDNYPNLEIISPNKNVNLSMEQRLGLLMKIADDFGFTKLSLNYRLSSSIYELPQKDFSSVEIPISKNQKENDVNFVWNLSKLNLATEDEITYYLEVFDNDNISGPKSSKSNLFTVRIPSINEMFENISESNEQIEQDLVKSLNEAEELKKDLEKISKDLKRDKKDVSWEEKEKIEKTKERFEKLQDKVDEINQKLSETKKDLQQNNLLSKETLEKYLELQKLMNEMSTEEMKKAMERLQNSLQNMDRKQIQDAFQNMKFDEEQFKNSVERTLNLFKRIQIEQKIDELVKRAEDLENRQNKLEEETASNNLNDKNKNENLAKQQNEISKQLKNVSQEMKELQDKMNDLKDMPNKEMEKLSEEFKNQQNEKLSDDAAENLKEMNKQSAMQMQNQISKNMQKMKQGLKNLQSSISQQNQMQTFKEMYKLLDNLINLSKQQEELKNKTNTNQQNQSLNENIKQQSELKQNLEKMISQMSDLSQKTFAITPEMGKSLGDANRKMNESINAMQNRNSNLASHNQGEAMKSVNEASLLMKGMMDQMMQGGGQSGGMMSLMQQLGKLSGMQMNLNNLTQMLQKGGQGNLSQEQQSQLQRLAQQQELIRKSFEQLNKEAKQSGKSKSLPANLDEILNQMKEVVTDMKTERLDDKLIQKQERILSKLLDAQRSINERDFEKERKANTGENIERKSPAKLNLSSEKNKNIIKDELDKSIREGYFKDYKDLIKKYFDSLQKEIKN